MRDTANRSGWAAGIVLAMATIGAATAAETMATTTDLLKNPQFKAAYTAALGPRAKERWLASMSNSAPLGEVSVAGVMYQTATPCKPHDCAENNLMLLFNPGTGAVVGKLFERGKTTLIGGPNPTMVAELEKLWKKEFRQQ